MDPVAGPGQMGFKGDMMGMDHMMMMMGHGFMH